jgi:hypothetical protein
MANFVARVEGRSPVAADRRSAATIDVHFIDVGKGLPSACVRAEEARLAGRPMLAGSVVPRRKALSPGG